MVRTVEVIAHYRDDPDTVFQSALRFSEMADAMAGWARYSGFPEDDTARQGDTIIVDVTFWGLFRQKGHRMFVERLDHQARVIQSRESGNGIDRWDHLLSVAKDGSATRWTDTVTIDAGWRTAFVARFAAYMYMRRHRHRRPLSLTCRIFKAS